MRQHHLPAVVVALLERLVPARGRAEVVGDLAEEYAAGVGRWARFVRAPGCGARSSRC